MRDTLYTFAHFFLLLPMTLFAVHCGKNSFDKGAIASGSAAVLQSTTTASNDRDVEGNDSNDTESTVASEPVSVGGAFLNCFFASSQSTSDVVAVQCEFSSQTLESGRAQNLLYGFTTGASRTQSTALLADREEFINDGARQVWNWSFYFKRSAIRDGWLYIDIQDRARVIDPIIKSDVAIPSLAPIATPTPTPTPTMLSFNSGPQKLGDDGAGVGVEAACTAIDSSTIAMARSRSYSITLSAETSLNLVFSNLCGVGTGQTNTQGSFTTAALRNANGAAVFQFNLASQAKLSYVSAKIPAGVYQLVITPASRNGALNDFVYSDLLIEGAGITVK